MVARSLEKEWNDALQELEAVERAHQEARRHDKLELSASDRARVTTPLTTPMLTPRAAITSRWLRFSVSFCRRISLTSCIASLSVAIRPPRGADGVRRTSGASLALDPAGPSYRNGRSGSGGLLTAAERALILAEWALTLAKRALTMLRN